MAEVGTEPPLVRIADGPGRQNLTQEEGTVPRTKPKPQRQPQPPAPLVPDPAREVMTLGEAAAYLRLPEADVLRAVAEQRLPARQLGSEWRFLKNAIQDWLRTGPPPKPSKEAQLAVIGSWKDDPYLDEMLKDIYRKRGRPMTEEGE
jgi:excisionase family DNA binding protein